MMIKSQLKKNIYTYYVSLVLLTIAISLPHAVLTVLLLSKEITLSQIMMIQAGYSFAVFISEYPSGLIADIYSKKIVFIFSNLFLLVMFCLVISMNNFWMLFIAWFMYGISSALETGTLEAEIINQLKLSKMQIDKFISNSNRLNFIALLIGSSVGSFIYYAIGIKLYWISIILTIMSIICVGIFLNGKKLKKQKFICLKFSEKCLFKVKREYKKLNRKNL